MNKLTDLMAPADMGQPEESQPLTHWIDADSPRIGRLQRAACGQLVAADAFDRTPSCEACRRRITDVDGWRF